MSSARVRCSEPGDSSTMRAPSPPHIVWNGADAAWRVIILIAGLDIQILGEDGSPLRRLTLDLTKDYQRQP